MRTLRLWGVFVPISERPERVDGTRCVPYNRLNVVNGIIDHFGNRHWLIIGAVMFRAVRISLPW